MNAPLIGITTSEIRRRGRTHPLDQSEPQRTELALGLKYPRAVECAGGVPVIIPFLEPPAVEPLLDRLSGICISGGPDLDPDSYGESWRHPELGETEPEVDRFELALLRAADARRLPILAICRGVQAMNVARGGSLHQHVPDLHGAITHRRGDTTEGASHPVRVEPESLLERVLGRTETEVNSFHHQAVSSVGEGLRPVAWAPDGLVEGLEAEDREFMLGVQWHAEALVGRREQEALFESLVRVASRPAGDGTLASAA